MAEKLRDLHQPIDVPLLDATVAAFYGTGSKDEVSFWLFYAVSLLTYSTLKFRSVNDKWGSLCMD